MTTFEFVAGRRIKNRGLQGAWLLAISAGQRRTLGALADAVTIVLVVAFARQWALLSGEAAPPSVLVIAGISALWVLCIFVFGGYSLPHLHTGLTEYRRVLRASLGTAGLVGVFCYLTGSLLSPGFFLVAFLLGTPGLLTLRYLRRHVMHRLRSNGMFELPVALVGGAAHVDDVAAVLRREKWLGYRVVGVVTDDPIEETASGLPVLGSVESLVSLVKEHHFDSVIFTDGSFPDSRHFRRVAWELEALDTHLIVVPTLTDVSAERLTARPVAGLPLVHVDPPQAFKAGRWAKRLFDVVGSALLILLALPILAVAALLVWLEDRGPVLFRQTRVGRKGSNFECLKIRSMGVRAEQQKELLKEQDQGAGVLFKMVADPRVTRVGRYLRRFSIDELPQLFNVLRGDMSLVGPRPALPTEVAQYDSDTVRRLDVRPGLTGLWQVSGRSELPWDETVRLDIYYVDNWSMLQDVAIMARTAKAVVGGRGAY